MDRIRDVRLALQSVWHLPTVLGVGLLLLLIVLLSQDPFDVKQGSGEHVEARITQLTSTGNRYQGRWPGLRVSARTDEGAVGVTTALPADLKGCNVGDLIEARQAGLKLYLKPSPCE